MLTRMASLNRIKGRETSPGTDRRSLTMLKLFNFFVYGSISILFTYFPLYFIEKGLSKFEIGMMMAGGPLVSIFANPFWGYWSDKYHNIRRTIVIMLTGNLIIIQAVFHLDAFALLYAVMLLFFFFQSPLFSQGSSLILNSIEGTPYKFGSFRMWGSLGWALMAVASGPVVSHYGVSNLWVIYSIMLLLSLSFTIGMPQGRSSAAVGKFTNKGYGRIFSNKLFLLFVLLGILISVPNSMNSTFVSLYIRDLGGKEVLIGWSAFLTAIFEVPVFLLFDRFLKKDTRVMVACLALVSLLFSLRWLLMSAVSEPWQVIVIQALHCITFGGYYYVGTSLTVHLIPAEYRASGQAAFALTWGGISGIMAGFLGGWLYQTMGAGIMYRINAVIALGGLIGFCYMLQLVRKLKVQTDEAQNRTSDHSDPPSEHTRSET